MHQSNSNTGRTLVWLAVVVLFLAHQDFWWWDNRNLVFGFLPVGLAYHAAFSLVAGLIWALACKFAWPDEIEAWASEGETSSQAEGQKR